MSRRKKPRSKPKRTGGVKQDRPQGRYPVVDLVRGIAILLMFVYHFSFDLTLLELTHFDFFGDPFWLNFRLLIVSLFLTTAGVSLHLATRNGLRPAPYFRRLGWLVGCALLVTLGSRMMFGERYIFFGILHFIAVASVLGLAFLWMDWRNMILGILLITFSTQWSHPAFDQPGLRWIGLMTHKPLTEDYVPLLPWFGVVLIGMALGQLLFPKERDPAFTRWKADDPVSKVLRFGGRHGLLIYIVHQPVFLGVLHAALWLARRTGG